MALNQVHDRDGIIGSGPRAGSKGSPSYIVAVLPHAA